MKRAIAGLVIALTCLSFSTTASADFIGQTILGPLGPNSTVNGDTTGANDDNDGFTSGDHFFFIWTGPDDAYQLDWPGGDLSVSLSMDASSIDLDLFLYEPGSLNDSSIYGITNTSPDYADLPAAPAGTYYIVVDSAFDAGPYTLHVSPEPSSLAFAGLGLVALVRRSRRIR